MASHQWDSIDKVHIDCTEYYCAFLDILGYKEKAALFFAGSYNLPGRINRAMEGVSLTDHIARPLMDITRLSVDVFSDSIIITNPADKFGCATLMIYIMSFISQLSLEGLHIRGGLSMGRHYSQASVINSRILISEALQRAYILESQKALYPRVLIDPIVIETLSKQELSRVALDGDDYMLHYAHGLINREGLNLDDMYREMIEILETMNRLNDPKSEAKLQWLLDYYVWTIHTIPDVDTSRFEIFKGKSTRTFRLLQD
ncbi:MAG TPA: hypothetical protein PKE26_15475 [Kiritimatiellia bacterium]|nr:hypothetical protein [Saprospiraceae bacterium]HMP00495.1 hypothetical protein [Kiritimatiellia bacterium]